MSKRCRQCGTVLGDNEGDFCSEGCEQQFERNNPGKLAQERASAAKLRGCGILIAIIVLIILFLSGAFK